LFDPTGAVLITSGLILAATAAPTSTPWAVVAGCLIALGAYVSVANFNEKIPFPGRAQAKRRKEDEEEALQLLFRYHQSSIWGKNNDGPTEEEFNLWFDDLRDFVNSAWGTHQGSGLIRGNWISDPAVCFLEVEKEIAELIKRVNQLSLQKGFDPLRVIDPEWLPMGLEWRGGDSPPFPQD
jgi:hypothetical protein